MIKKLVSFWKIILLDTVGVMLMIAALLTGWLPGPGGIPLFIIGLSLLAINHAWAKRYNDLLRQYADRLGDYIFVTNPKVQLVYDLIAPILLMGGIFLLYDHRTTLMTSAGLSLSALGITIFLGNRHRWADLKKRFKH